MKIIIASIKEHPVLYEQLMSQHGSETIFEFVEDAKDFPNNGDAYIDFTFKGQVYSPAEKPLLIGETIIPLKELYLPMISIGRFCAWQGFPSRDCWEIASLPLNMEWISVLMKALGKKWKIVADEPGLVSPRIISMIINEAFFALEEGVSSATEIDMAMKLGTNYPDGPFTWGKNIGYRNIFHLLKHLSIDDSRYTPHPLLLNHL